MATITFPGWVKVTPCETRTFSVTLTGLPHGAVRIVQSFPNRPMVKLARVGKPGFYYGWADEHKNVCPITHRHNCKSRKCELHYMNAPVRLRNA